MKRKILFGFFILFLSVGLYAQKASQWVNLESNRDGSGVTAVFEGVQTRPYFISTCTDSYAYDFAYYFSVEMVNARSLARFYSSNERWDQEDRNIQSYCENLLYNSLEYDPSEGEVYYVIAYVDNANRGWYFQMRWTSGRWLTYAWYYRVR